MTKTRMHIALIRIALRAAPVGPAPAATTHITGTSASEIPKRLLFLLVLLIAASACQTGRAPFASGEEKPESPERPNIVVIMADDMGYSDIAPYGGEIRTPTLSRLAEQGLRFTQFYNAARCVPTRASLLTGLYAHQAGLGRMVGDDGLPGYRGDLNEHNVTMAEVLSQAGYRTYMAGKWHVTRAFGQWAGSRSESKHNWPLQRGFDRFFGTIFGAGSYYDPVTLTHGNTPVASVPEDFYYTDAISDTTVSYIRSHERQADDTPFFAYVAYTAPHWPLHAPPEAVARYAGDYVDGWEPVRRARYERMKEMEIIDEGWTHPPPGPGVDPWSALSAQERVWYARAMAVYAAQISLMDRGIGRIVETLKAIGELDDTLILFLSDNGASPEVLSEKQQGGLAVSDTTRDGRPVTAGNEHRSVLPGPEDTYMSYGRSWANVSNTPFRGYKAQTYEGGVATPLIAYWPEGIEDGGRIVHEPGHVVDLMATVVDLAGADYPEHREGSFIKPMAGQSLAPAFTGPPGKYERGPMFFEHLGNRGVRKGWWKLVAERGDKWALYDLKRDRTETSNLAEERPEKVKELKRLYERWAERSNVESWPLGK